MASRVGAEVTEPRFARCHVVVASRRPPEAVAPGPENGYRTLPLLPIDHHSNYPETGLLHEAT